MAGLIEAALFLVFLFATLAILITPGPDMLYVMARSLGQGRRAGLWSVVGIGAGVLVHTLLAAFGLSALFSALPGALDAVRWVGAAYLVYLAVWLAFGANEDVIAGVAREDPPLRLITQAFLTNLLNPKAILFFLAFLPQFTDPSEPAFDQLLLLGIVVVALSMIVNAGYALLADRAASLFRASPRATRVQKWLTVATLGALAARIAMPFDA